MRYCVTRQQAGRTIQVVMEGKRNNWIARRDQGEVPQELGQKFNIKRVGDQVVLSPGEVYYNRCLKAAPDIEEDRARLTQVAKNLVGILHQGIEMACDSFKQSGGLNIPHPDQVILNEVIRQLRR